MSDPTTYRIACQGKVLGECVRPMKAACSFSISTLTAKFRSLSTWITTHLSLRCGGVGRTDHCVATLDRVADDAFPSLDLGMVGTPSCCTTAMVLALGGSIVLVPWLASAVLAWWLLECSQQALALHSYTPTQPRVISRALAVALPEILLTSLDDPGTSASPF
jgi:hypothetical protein